MIISAPPSFSGETDLQPSRLVQSAIDALRKAATAPPDDKALLLEERSVWEPASWLIQCCWQALAAGGAGDETIVVAGLAAARHPLAPLQALHRLAQHADQRPALRALVRGELTALKNRLLAPSAADDDPAVERLLLAASTAALVDDLPLACVCLERLDQSISPWLRIFAQGEWRTLLAESVAYTGLQPQTEHLVVGAIRRFDDAGVQFLHQVAALIAQQAGGEELSPAAMSLLAVCVETVRYAALTNVQNRRLAVAVLAQAGLVDDILAQLTTIAN
ncbi:MAG: hypothetical protein M3Q45_12315, partial [Chloroflexota bacterium]|nr:hypothetical protein [Chloroflexota bacterium]